MGGLGQGERDLVGVICECALVVVVVGRGG